MSIFLWVGPKFLPSGYKTEAENVYKKLAASGGLVLPASGKLTDIKGLDKMDLHYILNDEGKTLACKLISNF